MASVKKKRNSAKERRKRLRRVSQKFRNEVLDLARYHENHTKPYKVLWKDGITYESDDTLDLLEQVIAAEKKRRQNESR